MKKIILSLFVLTSFSALAESKLLLNVNLTPAGSFQAISENIKGDLVKKKGVLTASEIKIPIKSFKTGIDLRDEHLWKHLNYNQFNSANLTNLKGENGKASASLEVAGVKLPVSIDYKEKGGTMIGTFKVKAHDFKLPDADYMGIGVEDEVLGEVTMPFKQI
jgi:polyisoprenoid-binding protein YceI